MDRLNRKKMISSSNFLKFYFLCINSMSIDVSLDYEILPFLSDAATLSIMTLELLTLGIMTNDTEFCNAEGH
jgi:hypothetical protein